METPKAIIFDVGGVLRYSEIALHYSMKKAFENSGLQFPFSSGALWKMRGFESANSSYNTIKILMILLRDKKSLEEIMKLENAEELMEAMLRESVDDNLRRKIMEDYTKIFSSQEVEDMVEIYSGVKESIAALGGAKIILGISTNSTHAAVERDLKDVGLENFSVIICQEDVKNKKPHPEGILLACEKIGINPKETAYVGDAASDIAAAKTAGCISIALLCGMGTEKVLRAAKPDFVFKDVREMADYFFGEKLK